MPRKPPFRAPPLDLFELALKECNDKTMEEFLSGELDRFKGEFDEYRKRYAGITARKALRKIQEQLEEHGEYTNEETDTR